LGNSDSNEGEKEESKESDYDDEELEKEEEDHIVTTIQYFESGLLNNTRRASPRNK
jgi:hypothetical protein